MDNAIPTPNIVVFVECGSEKSSIVNLIAQKDIAPVGSGATGCTLESTCYSVSFDGLVFNVYDTAGLDGANGSSVPKQQAITQLYRLLTSLDTGVNLLILCMRAPRIRDNTYKNWRLFHDIICDDNVPIILVITGLEQERIMGQWWFENKDTFQKYGMHPNGVACITDTRSSATRRNQLKSGDHRLVEEHETRASAFGGFGTSPFGAVNSAFGGMPGGHDTSDRSVEESGYSKSQVEMQRQIKTCCLEHAYKVPPVELFKEIAEVEYEVRWCGLASPIERKTFRTEAVAGIRKLVQRCEVSEKEALKWGEALSKNQTYAFL